MKSKYNRTLILLLASALFAFLSASCGTVHGIGHDVETVGDEIQEVAR
jgi:predicted small secreted protein